MKVYNRDQWFWQNFINSMCDIKFWKGNENLRSVYKKWFFEILSGPFHFWPFSALKKAHCSLQEMKTPPPRTGRTGHQTKFTPMSTIPGQICHRCQWHRWQIMGTISGCWDLKVNLKAKMYLPYKLTLLPKGVQTKIVKTFKIEDFFIFHRCQQHQWCTLSCKYLREFSKKFKAALLVYSGAWGKLIHEKNQKSKISWHCPFKETRNWFSAWRHRFLGIDFWAS